MRTTDGLLPVLWIALATPACRTRTVRSAPPPVRDDPVAPAAPAPPDVVVPRRVEVPVQVPTAVPDAGPPAVVSHGALACDSDDDEVRVDLRGLLDGHPALTIELRFRADRMLAHGQPKEYLLVARGPDRHTDDLAVALQDGYGTLRSIGFNQRYAEADAACGGSARGSTWGEPLEPGRWYHYAATFARTPEGSLRQATFLDGRSRGASVTVDPERPCLPARELLLCHGAEVRGTFWRPFAGALDDVRISAGVRYTVDFTPVAATADATTLLLLDFEDAVVRDQGPHDLAVTTAGNPARVALR